MVTVEEMKQYLRIDFSEDDGLLGILISSAEELCASVARIPLEEYCSLQNDHAKTAVLNAVASMYEYRGEAAHLNLSHATGKLLFGMRKEGF